MINWQYYPKSDSIPSHLTDVVDVFDITEEKISSDSNTLISDEVLGFLEKGLENVGYQVEKSKKKVDKIHVPVLFGRNGKLEKSFDADAFNQSKKTVIEVEAGRAVSNYQFLKDLFQACMMHEVDYLVIAVRNKYSGNKDFEKVISFFDTLYASNRLGLPLQGILIVGY
jgi:hypothetical protein